MSGAFTVTHTNMNTCNSDAIKSLVKIVKYCEFLANVYSTVDSSVVCMCHVFTVCCINE